MHEAVRPADVHESAEVGYAGDAPAPDVALLQRVQQLILQPFALLLERAALRENDAVPLAVHLDDFEAHLLSDAVGEGRRGIGARRDDHLRERNEALQAVQVHDGAALVVPGYFGRDESLALLRLFELRPRAVGAGAVDRETGLPLGP